MAKLDDELARLKRLVAMRPKDASLQAKLGAIHEQKNEFLEAIGCYSVCVGANPQDLAAWARLGFCFMRLFKLKEAVETFDFVLQMDPRHLDAIYGRAVCLENLGDHVAAAEAMERAVAIAPDNSTIYPFRAYLRASHGGDPARTLQASRQATWLGFMYTTGRPVFASLNNLKKVTDDMLRLWRRVLDEVPESILILIGYERTQ